VKGIAFDAGALDCGVEKTEIESGIVANQDGAFATVRFHLPADETKHILQSGVFRDGDLEAERMMRIDAGKLQRGLVQIGGVAFAGDRGISRVEVSTDGGATWAPAVLRVPPLSGLTWVLWTYDWTPPRDGSFRIRARAVDGNNAAQEPTPASPFPNGAAGYDAITLLVST